MITQTATASKTPTAVLSREQEATIETTKTTSMIVARYYILSLKGAILIDVYKILQQK